jgi:class 3 adenylate cyclase/tetratricopeptide (TPR) repeat protein/energy-coupling factor transporter ATP-binding protein EcfA2
MDVTEWLSGLGLARYAPAFRDNDIDGEVLRRLTGADLRELGVASIGHRRRLLDAIAALGDRQSAGEQSPTSGHTPSVKTEAERRQLTVMFSDIVDSTSLSTALDPEDLQKVIAAFNHCVVQNVARFDGYIARYMGDSTLVFFGYPEAHEHDAERAIRTGLALIDAIGRVPAAKGVQLRVGIATGIVVVGDIIADGDGRLRDVVGETPNLAARLQAIAEPNSVVIADSTRSQVGAIFDFADLGPLRLKGFVRPQRAWRVLGESGVLSRFEALRSESTPLVGRGEELDLLLRRWQEAKAGRGRVVLLSGEPGIGKSRLVAALSHAIESESHGRLSYFCSPYNQDSALHPFIVQLERAAGFARDDAAEEKLRKLKVLPAPGAHGSDETTLLAELLSLPNSATELNLAPQRKREKLFEVLLHQIQTVAQSRPVLMILEDAHWIDPTSHELLDLMVDRISRTRVLLIVTSRTEFQHAWSGQPHVTVLALNRLDEREGVALVERLAGDAGLPRTIVDEIVQRADGVPLFVEELTKAVLEADVGNNDTMAPLPPGLSPFPSIPATLHASLNARFDRLGPNAKEVAQVGAVLGREFGYDLIEQTAQRPIAELRAGLDRLAAAGLLFCRGAVPQSSYVFKHALVQDAAYGTMLRTRRQELHARAAAVLGQQFSDLIERQPEILAYHLTAAGETERAVDQWLKAGHRAAARSAHLEAIGHFDRGLAALSELPDGPTRDGREIELQLARGPSLFAARGFAAAEAAQAYTRACELAEHGGDARQLFTAVNGLWQSANGAGKMLDCRRLSNRLQELTVDTADDALRLQAHHSAWATSLFTGDPEAARDHCAAGHGLYDPERHGLQHQLYGGHDPGSCALYLGAQAHWLLGHPEKGLALCSEGLALAERSGHPFSFACALQYYSMLHLDRGEPELALQRLGAAEALAADQRLGFVLEPQLLRGAALTAQGAFEEAVACVREGLGGRNGATRLRCYGLVRLADALTLQGKHDAALAAARDGLKTADMTEHRQWQAELHRFEGIALFGLGRLEEGQTALERAIRVARRQQAKAYELRAATSLARLWGEQRRRAAARDLLAPVYGWFGEGFNTADLKNAKALLDQLA